MTLIYSFIISGLICFLAELLLSHTKLTPGHITTVISCLGALLAFFNLYKPLIDKANMGAIVLISNFGNSLYEAALKGFADKGFIGIFSNMLNKSSLVITSTVIFSFIFVLIFKAKD